MAWTDVARQCSVVAPAAVTHRPPKGWCSLRTSDKLDQADPCVLPKGSLWERLSLSPVSLARDLGSRGGKDPMINRAMNDEVLRHATEYDRRLRNALRRARDLPEDILVRMLVDAATDAIVAECAAAAIAVDHAGFWAESQEAPPRKGHEDEEREVWLTLNVTVDGAASALMRPGGLPISIHAVGNQPATVILTLPSTNQQMATLTADILGQTAEVFHTQLRAAAAAANEEIERHRAEVRSQVRAVLEPRAQRLQAFRAATDALSIPVAPRGADQHIPLQPRTLTLRQLDRALSDGTPEWHLEQEIAEDIIVTIMSFTAALERLVRTADKLAGEDEETIRDLLLFILNANYQGAATGETFVSEGKADILLRWRDRNAFIGECKFWKGPATLDKALDQLLNRYTVWRDTWVALILFLRDVADATAAIDKAGAQIAEHPRLLQAITAVEPTRRRDYLLSSSRDQQRVVRLSLLPVVVPRAS
jgi:hypothetical protein